jgi:hypothetical protein
MSGGVHWHLDALICHRRHGLLLTQEVDTMTTSENLPCLIVCLGVAPLLLALAFKAMTTKTVATVATVAIGISPAGGIKFKAEGSRP